MEVKLLDLGGLSHEERTVILNVLQRDDEVRRQRESRIKQLKSEIHNIRLRSALRTGDDLSKMCARCHAPFGLFTNSGDICPGCHFRVCKSCRENLISHGWMCILCFRENQIRWISGDWMAKTSKFKQVRATDLVRASLRIKQENGTAVDKPSVENCSLSSDSTCSCSTSKKSSHENSFETESGLDETSFISSATCPLSASSWTTTTVLSSYGTHSVSSFSTSGMHGEFPVASCQEGTIMATGFGKTNVNTNAISHGHVLSVDSKSLRSFPGSVEGVLEKEDASNKSERIKNSSQDARSLPALAGRQVDKDTASSSVETLSEGRDAKALEMESEGPVVDALEIISPLLMVGMMPEGRGNTLMKMSAGQVQDQQSLSATVVVPESEIPYIMRRFLQSGDEASDTLSIISELTEPGESQNNNHHDVTDEELLDCTSEDDDEDGSGQTVCSKKHSQQSDKCMNQPSWNIGGPADKEAELLDGEDGRPDWELDVGDVLVLSLREEASSFSERKQDCGTSSRGEENGKSDGDKEVPICSEKRKQPPQSYSVMTYDTEITARDVAATSKNEGSGDRDKVEVSRANFALPEPDGHNLFPNFGVVREEVYFAGRDVQLEAERSQKKADTEATPVGAQKKEEEESWGAETCRKLTEAGSERGLGGDTKLHSLSLETKAENLLPDVKGEASEAVGATVEQHLKKGQGKENSIPWEVSVLDGEKACDDEVVESLVNRPSSDTVQKDAVPQNPLENVIKSTYVSSPVGKQPLEAELVLEPSFSKKANLVAELTQEKGKGDENLKDPSIAAEISSCFQTDNKHLVTGLPGVAATCELPEAGHFGQEVTVARDRAPDSSTQPKPVDSGLEVPIAMTRIPVIREPTTPSESKQIKPGSGRVQLASPQQDVPDGAESRPTPNISISRPAEPDSAGGSENSGSPEKRLSPHRTSHLSIPSAATGSQSSSHDERSFDDDDDNIDELFAKHRTGSRLSAVRNNIGDSRESLASVYSNAGEINYGRIPVTGDIIFGLDYDHRHSILKIDVRNCQNIAPVDTKHNRSDPYVKVYLLPDKTRSGKRKTKIKKHTLNPVFNEVLTYNISRGELENRTLWVTVWHSDRFGRNDFLGEVIIPMDTYRFDDPSPFTYALESREQESVAETMQYKGELVLSIMYVTPEKVAASSQKSKSKKKSKAAVESTGEVHVMIKSASNLTAVRSNGTSDPFVKGYLLPERARTGKQKTSVVKNSVNPMWNHILVFDGVTLEELADRSLELTVWDHEKLGTNEFLGGARLNTSLGVAKGVSVDWMDARGEEASTWQAMIERSNTWIDARIPLRASMGKPSKK